MLRKFIPRRRTNSDYHNLKEYQSQIGDNVMKQVVVFRVSFTIIIDKQFKVMKSKFQAYNPVNFLSFPFFHFFLTYITVLGYTRSDWLP